MHACQPLVGQSAALEEVQTQHTTGTSAVGSDDDEDGFFEVEDEMESLVGLEQVDGQHTVSFVHFANGYEVAAGKTAAEGQWEKGRCEGSLQSPSLLQSERNSKELEKAVMTAQVVTVNVSGMVAARQPSIEAPFGAEVTK